MNLDFAIIGAGVSGLAAARRVQAERPHGSLAIFDRESRVGGRIMSHNLGGQAGIVELGAGRFNAAAHPRVRDLVAKYGLPVKPFDYRLAPLQAGLRDQAHQIMSEMCGELARHYAATDNLERYAVSLRTAAERVIGGPRFELLVELCGYDTLSHPELTFEEGFGVLRHHPETHHLFDTPDVHWTALCGGLSGLTDAMAAEISDQGAIHLGHNLVEIHTDTGAHDLVFETQSGRQHVRARKVLMAMPIWNTGRVRGLNLSESMRKRIQSVPLIKAYFSYADRWWDGLGMSGFCLSTPTPFRKIYFPKDANHLMIYCDGHSAEELCLEFQDNPDIQSIFSRIILDALPLGTQQASIPAPLDQGYRFWPHGISFWRCGWNPVPAGYWDIGQDATVCSDIFTRHLGWIEGALESADQAVRSMLTKVDRQLVTIGADAAQPISIGQ